MKLLYSAVLCAFLTFSLSAKQEPISKPMQNIRINQFFKNVEGLPKSKVKSNSLASSKELQALDSVKIDLTAILGYTMITQYTYDSRGNVIKQLDIKEQADERIKTNETNYTYDNQNRLIEEENYFLNEENEEWVKSDKYVSTYESDLLKVKIQYNDYDNTGNWNESVKYEYNYGQDDLLQEELTYNYYDGEWLPSSKINYIYDENGNLTEKQTSTNPDSWVVNLKVEYTYDNGNMINESHKSIESDITTEFEAIVYEYNSNNQLTNKKHYTIIGDALTLQEDVTRVFDSNGNIDSETTQEYSEDTQTMENTTLINYTYNMDYTRDQLLVPDDTDEEFGAENFNNMPIAMTMKIWAVLNWIDGASGELFYSPKTITLNVKDIKKSNINVYPNPTVDVLSISLENTTNSADIKIFDVFGKEVISQNLINSNQIDVKSLITGTYIYVINENGVSYSGKIIKE